MAIGQRSGLSAITFIILLKKPSHINPGDAYCNAAKWRLANAGLETKALLAQVEHL